MREKPRIWTLVVTVVNGVDAVPAAVDRAFDEAVVGCDLEDVGGGVVGPLVAAAIDTAVDEGIGLVGGSGGGVAVDLQGVVGALDDEILKLGVGLALVALAEPHSGRHGRQARRVAAIGAVGIDGREGDGALG